MCYNKISRRLDSGRRAQKADKKPALTQRWPGVQVGGDEDVIPPKVFHLLVSVSECGECAPAKTIFSEQVVLHFLSPPLYTFIIAGYRKKSSGF